MLTCHRAGALALVFASLAASGCVGNPPGPAKGITLPNLLSPASPGITLTGNPMTDFAPVTSKIAPMTVADVDAALADAEAQKPVDGVGVACWSAIKDALPVLQLPKGTGIATVIQHGRDAQTIGPQLIEQCASIIPFLGVAALPAAL